MLLAFDAAARSGSFTAAAGELSLTQGAISRQVRALENQLGVDLFRRVNRTIVLTEAGSVYAREIRAVLSRIQAASLATRMNPRAGLLTVAILPTFGTRWLIPRLPSFVDENPDITVNFVTKLSPFDLTGEDIQAAIHFGKPDWPQTDATFLMREEAVPVASPELLSRYDIARPGDLVGLPLLHLTSRADAWGDWFRSHAGHIETRQGLLFEQFSIVAQAAVAGLGVAILPKFLIQPEIERNELAIVFDQPVVTEEAYYLMIPAQSSSPTPAWTFASWLLKQCED